MTVELHAGGCGVGTHAMRTTIAPSIVHELSVSHERAREQAAVDLAAHVCNSVHGRTFFDREYFHGDGLHSSVRARRNRNQNCTTPSAIA